MTETPQPPAEPREGNLHDLDDDTYFAALDEFPGALDEHGQRVTGLFADVVDARESKARAAAAAQQQDGDR